MKLNNKLYYALVVGGGVLTTGCASYPVPAAPADPADPTASPDAMDCSKVCEDTGSGVMCPEPTRDDGSTNCCWLMSAAKHPCCPK